jgi:succinate dehydrogenase / fumarate reductase iron-sulfur subunit
MSEGVAAAVTRTMAVRLKVWRYDSATGERALQEYEIEAPEEATLLDCLDLVKDRVDGTLAYRKSCRMMICGSCGMRMDGAAVLACKTRMQPLVESGHVPVISAMGNLPIVRDLVVDMEPFWSKFRAVGPWLQPGYDRPEDGKEYVIPQERMNAVHKEALCINCGCCVSECNAMESDPDFLGPQALAKGMRFVGDPRDGASVERLELYNGENGIWECTRCFYCNERCPKGVDPRDAIAKLGAESIRHGIDRDIGAKHAKWFTRSSYTTGWLRETELVPRSLGIVGAIKELSFARQLIMHNKAGIAFPPHVAERVDEARALRDLVQERGRPGALGIVQGERALARLAHGAHEDEDLEAIYERPNAAPRPYLPGEEKGQAPVGGSAEGMGSRTQADVTPGAKPTSKPEGGA